MIDIQIGFGVKNIKILREKEDMDQNGLKMINICMLVKTL